MSDVDSVMAPAGDSWTRMRVPVVDTLLVEDGPGVLLGMLMELTSALWVLFRM